MLIYECQWCGKTVVRAAGDQGRGRACSISCGNRLRLLEDTRPRRFWAKVQKSDGCWLWTGATTSGAWGYGKMRSGPRGSSRIDLAHRYSWEFHKGPIPTSLDVLHHCDMPRCVRPDHLFLGTQADNNADRDRKDRHGSKRLTGAQVFEIRTRRANGEKVRDIGAAYGVSHSYVSMLTQGKRR